MRYTGPKNRISRREKVDLSMKTLGSNAHSSMLRKINISPGQHGVTRVRRKLSERGRQIREKQKLRYMFGLTEKQLGNYFRSASKQEGNTADNLIQKIEKRLDNVVFRVGFAPTRASSRQLVNHGHVSVNDQKLDIPSYQVQPGDVVSIDKDKTQKIPYIQQILSRSDITIPPWLEKKVTKAKIISKPDTEDISKQINIRLVIEYYSK